MYSFTASIQPYLQPTFVGHVANLNDALLVVEACLSGTMHHISRFPRQNELPSLVRSGNTFVYAEVPTGEGDWDHGKSWMILGHEDGLYIQRDHLQSDVLFKKSASVIVQGIRHNIVSYYKVEDTMEDSFEDGNILNEALKRPSQDPRLEGISLRQELASLLPKPSYVTTEDATSSGRKSC